MMYLIATGSDIDALNPVPVHAEIGIMTSPRARGRSALNSGRRWASDCDALSKHGHDFGLYDAHLYGLAAFQRTCLFVVVPDLPGDGEGTLSSYFAHAPLLHEYGFPLAYVMQDDSEYLPIPEDAQVAFLGGTDPWRMTWGAAMLRRARAQGMRTHVGRVNSNQRLRSLALTECDSADGTHTGFVGLHNGLREVSGWLNAANAPRLFAAAAVPPVLTPYELHGEQVAAHLLAALTTARVEAWRERRSPTCAA